MPNYVDVERFKIWLSEKVNEGLVSFSSAESAASLLRYAPTEDVEPVVHAHWIHRFCDHRNDYLDVLEYPYICSACRVKNKELTKRCPECGARMDKEVKYD